MNPAKGLNVSVRHCGIDHGPSPYSTSTVKYDLFVKAASSGEITNLCAVYGSLAAHYYVTREFGILSYEVSAVHYTEINADGRIEVIRTRAIGGASADPVEGIVIDLPIPAIQQSSNFAQLVIDADLDLHVHLPETDCYERLLVFALKITLARKPDTF